MLLKTKYSPSTLRSSLRVGLCVLAALFANAASNAHAAAGHEVFVATMNESAFFFDNQIVKDAPFSATATTRSVQQLADGNRIVNEETTRITRGSDGRVRREGVGDRQHRETTISDPANKRSWVLNHSAKTAFQMPSGFDFLDPQNIEMPDANMIAEEIKSIQLPVDLNIEGGAELAEIISQEIAGALQGLPAEVVVIDHRATATASVAQEIQSFAAIAGSPMHSNQGVTETKPLGQKTLSGIRVEGTLHTTTIPKGAIGNEAAIVITKTTWYAPDLMLMISTEETDPRFGAISYTVTIDSQNEPDTDLFDVPAGYQIIGADEP